MIRANGLSKKMGEHQVLDQVNLEVKRGGCLGILGPNGSGKSTLVKLLVGEEAPDQGTIYLHNKELSSYTLKERAQKMAVLTQEGIGAVSFSVEEVVQMGRHPYQGKWPWLSQRDHEVVTQVMKATHIEHLKCRPFHQLSGGEQQRVAIAKAMAQEPELLILDEPTTYLDIQYQLTILDLLRTWQREKQLTIVIVLHDLNLAAQYCNRLLLLKEGRVIIEGTPKEVMQPHWIEEVYGVKPIVISHPEVHVPQLIIQSQGLRGETPLFEDQGKFGIAKEESCI